MNGLSRRCRRVGADRCCQGGRGGHRRLLLYAVAAEEANLKQATREPQTRHQLQYRASADSHFALC